MSRTRFRNSLQPPAREVSLCLAGFSFCLRRLKGPCPLRIPAKGPQALWKPLVAHEVSQFFTATGPRARPLLEPFRFLPPAASPPKGHRPFGNPSPRTAFRNSLQPPAREVGLCLNRFAFASSGFPAKGPQALWKPLVAHEVSQFFTATGPRVRPLLSRFLFLPPAASPPKGRRPFGNPTWAIAREPSPTACQTLSVRGRRSASPGLSAPSL